MKSRRTIKRRKQPLRNTYGEMILKKGAILYHTSSEPFQINLNKPMLFLTFHPSEYIYSPIYNHLPDNAPTTDYVTRIILKKDISLFFMIDIIKTHRVFSLLQTLVKDQNVNIYGLNLTKQHDENLKCFVKYLQEENFDGWFSSINSKLTVEVALINNISMYSVLESNYHTQDWYNVIYPNTLKQWGTLYPISLIQIPATLTIDKRYKSQIEHFLNINQQEDKDGTVFQILLNNANIVYTDKLHSTIHWDCDYLIRDITQA